MAVGILLLRLLFLLPWSPVHDNVVGRRCWQAEDPEGHLHGPRYGYSNLLSPTRAPPQGQHPGVRMKKRQRIICFRDFLGSLPQQQPHSSQRKRNPTEQPNSSEWSLQDLKWQ